MDRNCSAAKVIVFTDSAEWFERKAAGYDCGGAHSEQRGARGRLVLSIIAVGPETSPVLAGMSIENGVGSILV